jgi:hypothetical protein
MEAHTMITWLKTAVTNFSGLLLFVALYTSATLVVHTFVWWHFLFGVVVLFYLGALRSNLRLDWEHQWQWWRIHFDLSIDLYAPALALGLQLNLRQLLIGIPFVMLLVNYRRK